jgi:hypothetical protein
MRGPSSLFGAGRLHAKAISALENYRVPQNHLFTLTLATALAAATLVGGIADAKKPNNGPKNNHWVFHHHERFARLRYVQPVVTDVVRVATPGPCTCLTKGYTPEGMVVFKDQCTKEIAAAPVDCSTNQAQVETTK